jgi:DnaJ-class molecular chaperone
MTRKYQKNEKETFCNFCDGSGLGLYDGSKCRHCNGTGLDGEWQEPEYEHPDD